MPKGKRKAYEAYADANGINPLHVGEVLFTFLEGVGSEGVVHSLTPEDLGAIGIEENTSLEDTRVKLREVLRALDSSIPQVERGDIQLAVRLIQRANSENKMFGLEFHYGVVSPWPSDDRNNQEFDHLMEIQRTSLVEQIRDSLQSLLEWLDQEEE